MAPPMKPASNLNPANLLTLLRLVLVPVFALALLEGRFGEATLAFAGAAATDFLDGWVARRFGYVTALGVFIDPLADKALQLTAITLLAWRGIAPVWIAVLGWAREILVVSGFTLLALVAHIRGVRSSWLGKVGTFAQMSALALVLWARSLKSDPRLEPAALLVLGAAILVNFVAGLEYAWKGLKAYEAQSGTEGPG